MNPKIRRTITTIDEPAWGPIKYPDAIFYAQTGTWISDAEIAECPTPPSPSTPPTAQRPGSSHL